MARFQREAQVLASLNHPGIAAIYGIEEQDETRALVLELVEGPTLADRIAQGPIPVEQALPIAKLLERLKTQVPGEVVGIEFEREHGRWVYEFKVIDSKGRLLEVYVDAHTGEVLSMEED